MATDPGEIAALEADLHVAEVDGAYSRYFPFLERYVSLYPPASKGGGAAADDDDGDDAVRRALRSPRPEMWSAVERAMQEGKEALERLRDRRPEAAGGLAVPSLGRHSAGSSSAVDAAVSKREARRGGAQEHEAARGSEQKGARAVNGARKEKENDRDDVSESEQSDSSGGGAFFEEDDH